MTKFQISLSCFLCIQLDKFIQIAQIWVFWRILARDNGHAVVTFGMSKAQGVTQLMANIVLVPGGGSTVEIIQLDGACNDLVPMQKHKRDTPPIGGAIVGVADFEFANFWSAGRFVSALIRSQHQCFRCVPITYAVIEKSLPLALQRTLNLQFQDIVVVRPLVGKIEFDTRPSTLVENRHVPSRFGRFKGRGCRWPK